jgi:hypothetical protein
MEVVAVMKGLKSSYSALRVKSPSGVLLCGAITLHAPGGVCWADIPCCDVC